MTSLYLREKVDLNELLSQGYCIIDDHALFVEHRMDEVMNEQGITMSSLAKKTGISRQQIHAIVKKQMIPRIDFVLKISSVLKKPVEELFWLTEDAWVEYERENHDDPLFYDMVHGEKVNAAEKKRFIKETGYVYYHKKTKEMVREDQLLFKWKGYKERYLKKELEKVKEKHPSLSVVKQKSLAIQNLKTEFFSEYDKIFKRIGKRIKRE